MRRVVCLLLCLCFGLNCLAMAGTTAQVAYPPEPSAYITRGPIRIDGNAGFNATNGVTGGDGSQLNPWMIENFEIDGTGNGSCVYVGNTTDYFSIENCWLHNASGGPGSIYCFNSSVMLFNVSHGMIFNSTLNNSEYGVYLYGGSFNNSLVQNSMGQNSQSGIMMDLGSYGNEIINCTVSENSFHGIYLYRADYNLLRNSTVLGNGNSGLMLYSSEGNWVTKCSMFNNTYAGVQIYSGSERNGLAWNNISQNGYGVRIFGSANNTVYNNNFANNTNNAYDNDGGNSWDYGKWDYTIGGNFWDDYSGGDSMNGPGQNLPGSDGLGDAPYLIVGGGAGANDSYPLMLPFGTQAPADAEPPFATAWGPVGNGTAADAVIFIQWNESMDWASVEAAFAYTDGSHNWTSANGTWSHDLAFNSTFTPDIPLDYETAYFLSVNCTARDFAGNPLDQNGNGTGGEWPGDALAWNFTTTDRAPYVVSTVPADGQVDVDPNKPLKVTFSERMNRTSVENGFSFTNGSHVWNSTHGLVFWNTLATEFTFAPAEPLSLNQTYVVTLNGTIVVDYGGKTLEGRDYTWDFKTWLEPPAPHVIDTYPPAGSINVNVNTYINIAFDAEMDPESMADAFSYTDGNGVWAIDSGTADWFSDNTLFSFQPTERLDFSTTYTVRITSNATSVYGKKLDGNDNGVPDTADDYVFIFTTCVEPPVVTSHYPRLNQMDVPVSLAAIYINFSKPMLLATVTNAVSIYPTTPYTPSFSGGGTNLTLVLASELAVGAEYRVTVLGTAQDLDGSKLDGNADGWAGDKFVFNFFTEGMEVPEMPRILRVWPTANSTIPAGSESFYVAVTFNVAMNRTSVEGAFSFTNASKRVNGTFAWAESGASFRFMPTEALAYNTTYTCTVQDTAKDERGNRLENTTIWHYTTETVPPGRDWKDWVTYGALAFLIVMVVILYMANRSLRRDLKRTRVKLKRLKKQAGIEDEEPDISKDGQDGTPGGGEPAPEEAVSEAEGPENPDN